MLSLVLLLVAVVLPLLLPLLLSVVLFVVFMAMGVIVITIVMAIGMACGTETSRAIVSPDSPPNRRREKVRNGGWPFEEGVSTGFTAEPFQSFN